MGKIKVTEVLRNDRWVGVQGENAAGPFLLRYRIPVLAPSDTKGYEHVLKIVWAYADENSEAMPKVDDSEKMAVFENRFCEAVEHDRTAILTAVLTFDGARQWVFYTGNIDECGERLRNMPQNDEPYPLELTTERDPGWNYFRKIILAVVPKQDLDHE
ncbi:MAG TPA: DUF695 domain-containing protein [Gemmataceae bacterium]|nr:DUF695 domain-containing protein [Gemmataceae bacterium]